jgi:hypothetical protein
MRQALQDKMVANETPRQMRVLFHSTTRYHRVNSLSQRTISSDDPYLDPPDWGERTTSLRVGDKTVLEPGMTFHFMPGLWFEDWGLEITESIVTTPTGSSCLCDVQRKLFVKN